MKKIVTKTLCMATILVVGTTSVIFGHSGRTDSSGGHKDNKNKSGLGSYHYHCGGYPAHLHTNGCPYTGGGTSQGSTGSTPKPQVSDTYKKQQANKEGYNKGYECGYNNLTNESSDYTGSYTNDYESGYENGYSAGRKKLEDECTIAREKGYAIGTTGAVSNDVYTNETIKTAYNDGYEKGLVEYKEKKIEEYETLGKEDGNLNKEKIDLSNIDLEFKNAYETAYNNSQKELENKYKKLGREEALKGNEYKNNNMGNEKFNKWFKLGYEEGKLKIEEEKENAYSLGYEGQELVVTEEMKSVVKSIQESYDKGVEEKNKEMLVGGVTIAGIGAVGGSIYYKKKKSKKKEL